MSTLTLEAINAAIAEVEKIPAPEYRGYFLSPEVNSALASQLEGPREPVSLLAANCGMELHVREWMANDVMYPIPFKIRSRKEFEEFEFRVRCTVEAERFKNRAVA